MSPMKKPRTKGLAKPMKKDFMAIAIREARRGMERNEGGPFGAVIVRGGQVVARAHNRVISSHDPTAHAEVLAIRRASKKLGRFDLSDCAVYSTCEPCPMCLAAIYWAKIRRLYFGCTREDAAQIRFDDRYIYRVLKGSVTKPRLRSIRLDRDSCLGLFRAWIKKRDRVQY
jgi:guanine deaminase